MTSPRFALVGAAGFVAPRHLAAIQHVGGKLVAALDPHDAVGILDRFDKTTEFFTDEYRFERWLEKQRLDNTQVDWLVVCSPNYMHDRHIRMGLWSGAKVLCEKPLVVNPDNLDRIAEMENSFKEHADDRRVFTVLQLRHIKALKKLRDVEIPALMARQRDGGRDLTKLPLICQLTYLTPRGRWYGRSWKGDPQKSGGIITNIGIHLLDMLLWLFGPVRSAEVRTRTDTVTNGSLVFDGAVVDWHLSLEGDRVGRRLTIDGEIDLNIEGFENLHNTVYEETLAGRGHGIEDARPALELVAKLR